MKKKNKKLNTFVPLVLCIVILASLLLLSACGSEKNTLVGRWKGEKNYQFRYLYFYNDGTYSSSDVNHAGRYSISDNYIRLAGILEADYNFKYEVKGDQLILNSNQIYSRIKD